MYKVELDKTDLQNLKAILDIATKQGGLEVAQVALQILNKIKEVQDGTEKTDTK